MNMIFENGKELKTAEELGKAYYACVSKEIPRQGYDLSRITGSICNCSGEGVFDLLPIDSISVIHGKKRYMKCRVCKEITHL